jgi:anti-sigma regulatory factor (Ser/Thr protein kinase)/GAF domain-containing protein
MTRRGAPVSASGAPSSRRRWFRRGPARGQQEPLEGLDRGSASSRRRLIAAALVAVVLLAGIIVALAWSQYGDAKSRAAKDLHARVVAVGAIVDTYFDGQVSTLNSIAKAPMVVQQDPLLMTAYFRRLAPAGNPPFSGGIAWVDRTGTVRASSLAPAAKPINISDREYFRSALATRSPNVSAGLIGRRNSKQQVVVAVPTFSPRGDASGVLIGSILLSPTGENRQALELGYGDIQVIDRNGRVLLGGGFAPVQNTELLKRIRDRSSGVITSTKGLDGGGDDVVAFAASRVPAWVTVIDRPRSAVFADARRALYLELGSLAVGLLLVLAILVFVARRARRDSETQKERARSWIGLTRSLTGASTPADVAESLLSSLAAAFPNAVAVVAIESGERLQIRTESRLTRARRVVESAANLETIATLGREGPITEPLDRSPELREIHAESGRRLKAVHTLPIAGKDGEAAGTVSLVSAAPRLVPSEWALLLSFADQAAHALQRALLFAHEHELALRLQRSLLPERLPTRDGLDLEGYYRAGEEAVEVGGDWYDAVRRPDGIVHLCVGDVSGKGVGAAVVMSRQRHTFEVYGRELQSPAQIVRHMLQHTEGDSMITLAVVSLDPYTGRMAYTCVGHPPPLLLDRSSGQLTRLDAASAPPMGVAGPADVVEAVLPLPEEAVLVLYTDGLVERRGRDIDRTIGVLGELVSDEPGASPAALLTKMGAAIGPTDDDVALLVASIDLEQLVFEMEINADPKMLGGMRRRLEAWLMHREVDEADVVDVILSVSEACNNAIEHAYRDAGGGPVDITVAKEGDALRIVVEDHGLWRDQRSSEERGRGLMLISNLMHSTAIETGLHGTRVTFTRRLGAGQETAEEYASAAPGTP